MKTIISNRGIEIKTGQKLMAALLFLVILIGCSKEEDGGSGSSVQASASTFSIDGINNCSTSLGAGTILSFITPYTASQNLTIKKMLIKTKVTDGDYNDATNTTFTDTGSKIEWVTCFTYGSQDWVEYEVRLEASDGSVSNASKVRVNKPNDAN